MLRPELTGAQRTLLIPLYARALDYRSKRSILHDRRADEIVRSIDFDFSTLGVSGGRALLPARSRQLDEWAREFLAGHPDALVLNLGCGLDSRYFRLGPSPTALWVDVDFPEVIEFRRNFYAEAPGYRMLATPLTAPDWLETLPGDRPVLAIADGVLEYLAEPDIATLFHRLVAHFGRGELAFDVMSLRLIRSRSFRLREATGGSLRWGVDDLGSVDAIEPRLRRTAARSIFATPYSPLGFRLVYVLLYPSRRVRQAIRLLRYDFP
jgi:O-methyltransferase involved in polyketide biosynthesis